MTLPSRSDAWARLRTAGPPEWVLRHVACVEALAVAMAGSARATGQTVDVALVQAGAILHDLGRSVTQDVRHARVGADLLRSEGANPRLVGVVERHTGAGIPPDEAVAAGLPPGDYVPHSLEERIVAHADNLYSGDKRLTLAQVVAKYEANGLPAAAARIRALHDDLCLLLGTDPEGVAPADLPHPP